MLHLSAAFDTVDHTILVSRLANRFGIRENALNWFRSYLQLCKQFVTVNGIDSSLKDLQYGVPQGSRVSYFTVARKHGIPFHLLMVLIHHRRICNTEYRKDPVLVTLL